MTTSLSETVEAILEQLRAENRYVTRRILSGPQGHVACIDGKDIVVLCSNNYLGLTNHPKVAEAAKRAIDEYGVGLGCARGVCSMTVQEELEQRIARHRRTEASICFQTGYDTNLATISTLMDEKDVIFSDELNHASIVDGCRSSKAKRLIYRHRDMGDLERLLKAEASARHRWIITDSVFSMEGDIAPLDRIVSLAERYSAFTYLDDAHAEGVLGRGMGSVEHFGLRGKVTIQMGTLSKALGLMGGYIACDRAVADYLFQRARPFIFATGHLPPPIAAAAIAALEIIENEPEIVDRLWSNSLYFKAGLKDLGYDTGHSETPVTPVILGRAELTQRFSEHLRKHGIFVQAFSFPVVPEGKARLRTIVSATHTVDDLDRALKAFSKVGKELQVI